MKPSLIQVGVTYHNGKEGPRSYSARKVLRTGVPYSDWMYGFKNDGIEYEQIAGKEKGKTFVLSLKSFAQWAKGEVKEA
ncbi:hypothetical protein [Paenibacillus glucanolyticus]|uniref:hypothetical protein n=1 Tax=Paenibacillus glucanolyticus TaxID=59843 RepID=UPI00096CD88D|nr:hypothetical protein [Paenibacillus glucanolyticus]OMF76670.1 hypothetical protein BK142_14190 [Paenibacillus glucanolyticus]